jgi:hypothetical protein
MLHLLHRHYEQPDSPNKLDPITDVPAVFWGIEETATREPSPDPNAPYPLLRGWMGKECGICGSPEVACWDSSHGYRCAKHLTLDCCPDCGGSLMWFDSGWMVVYRCIRCSKLGFWPVPCSWMI